MVEVEDHLRMGVNHIERRINLIDNKAAALVAIQVGLFAVVAFMVDKLYPTNGTLKLGVLLFLGLFAAVVVGCLLQVIRPTRHPLSRSFKTDPQKIKCPGLLWPDMKEQPSETRLRKSVEDWKPDDFKTDLYASLFALHCLVFEKYNYYRLAALLAKIQLITIVLVFLLVFMMRIAANDDETHGKTTISIQLFELHGQLRHQHSSFCDLGSSLSSRSVTKTTQIL